MCLWHISVYTNISIIWYWVKDINCEHDQETIKCLKLSQSIYFILEGNVIHQITFLFLRQDVAKLLRLVPNPWLKQCSISDSTASETTSVCHHAQPSTVSVLSPIEMITRDSSQVLSPTCVLLAQSSCGEALPSASCRNETKCHTWHQAIWWHKEFTLTKPHLSPSECQPQVGINQANKVMI